MLPTRNGWQRIQLPPVKGKSLLLSLIANIDASIDQTLSKLKQGYQIDRTFRLASGEVIMSTEKNNIRI